MKILDQIKYVVLFTCLPFISLAEPPEGTWEYHAPQAVPEYSSGQIVINRSSVDSYYILIKANGQEFTGNEVIYSDGNLSFSSYIESEYVTFKIKIAGNNMTGTATYSEGSIELTAKLE